MILTQVSETLKTFAVQKDSSRYCILDRTCHAFRFLLVVALTILSQSILVNCIFEIPWLSFPQYWLKLPSWRIQSYKTLMDVFSSLGPSIPYYVHVPLPESDTDANDFIVAW